MVIPLKETKFLNQIELGIGAWAWGDKFIWGYGRDHNDADIKAAFDVTIEAGIRFVDTAEAYGQGQSEKITGELVRATEGSILVATKFFPYPWRLTRGSLETALRGSLERLGMDRVDLYQIHWPFPPRSIETWVEELAKVQRLGLTRTVGVSNYDKNQMQRAYTTLAKYDIPLASNQVEYSLLNRKVEKNGLLARCQELGIRLIAYSPLAKGLLTGKYSLQNPPTSLRASLAPAQVRDIPHLIKLMTEIGQDFGGKTPGQVALNWTICKGTLPIPGAKNASQAEQNAGALGWRLTPEQIKSLDDASDKFA